MSVADIVWLVLLVRADSNGGEVIEGAKDAALPESAKFEK